MKELSIEEKAKRYDEASKEASVAYKDEDRHLKATLERIFPKLKESEDERIRKEIIDFLMGTNKYGTNEKCESWIAWLEKQGEHKPAWSEEDEEQFIFCCAAIELSNYSSDKNRNYAISFLESLKDRVQPQPKQEWSMYDETKEYAKKDLGE